MKTKVNTSLLKQVVRTFEDRTHFGLNKVQTRSEVNRTKKKLYKQKGTGGARHGARSAPIFVGGGKAHGPKGVKRELNLPLKMKKKALDLAISFKKDKKELINFENVEKIKSTKDAAKKIKETKLKGKILIILTSKNQKVAIFFRNIEGIKVLTMNNIGAYEIMKYKNILLEKESK
ncbi:50S ribosomal protein L4 [Candidatus Woesebacteria bacterium GWC2_33_12]|uniref:Large ribosomal subunit protein uL4 n=1 Tax=Candidatus Woesebacteria bacterium GW2011_GWB1_33_22 TaxID=1618566 RepID=A0A0G0CNE3_9BACT|nr:MAG: 50S ribosomal protein L4 [Candidatus Woesebacteria bacterium GW2011_GWC2_33_12]KKP42188.1 MAG: 50S ribosomal protein L4 [Candidatus Woesebacteria bacterium GW2011_GWA2_33_20]KKP44922.1 MAG: 50S ribosomal protein L4 [Candidatus Woesebacteria bacterium GW2011_GWB1_33_22]KKP46736.1 MAG: 50S ribosomal protein L4 [Microgenomates group bacterium GW2011_GWC1_33_28]KKP50636.1 MAG: 50S ribosomal protein L4 [Candidatus Woesebacteria bacterium GW2011_GWA1_33_33]OGM07780.1 MAG: 50S ribosomal prote